MKIYLVQHGKTYTEEEDPERKLTEEGIRETERVAKILAQAGVKPSSIVHSGKRRAEDTAKIFAEILGVDKVEKVEGLNPLDDPGIWLERLRDAKDDIMIVGHLPHLSKLAGLLLNAEEPIEFRYSGVVCIERSGESFRLKWYVTPDIV